MQVKGTKEKNKVEKCLHSVALLKVFFHFLFLPYVFFLWTTCFFPLSRIYFFFNNWVSFHDLNKGPFCFRLENTDRVEQAEAMTVPLCFTYRRWPSCDPTYLQEHVSYSLITCISLERFLSRLLYYSFFFLLAFSFSKHNFLLTQECHIACFVVVVVVVVVDVDDDILVLCLFPMLGKNKTSRTK